MSDTESMNMQGAIRAIAANSDLTEDDMSSVMTIIMSGEATPAQIGAFLMGLAVKGETVTEIAAAASVMRSFATGVDVDPDTIVDPVGTGGDGIGLFNVSTASAFVTSAAGAKVAKHGNRAMSGKSGAADLLESAGVNLELNPEQVARCINEVGIGFMFAPAHHGATRHAVGPRREIGVRNVFNLLGPMTNPAGALRQMIGVFDSRWVRPVADVLSNLGSKHVLVVHSDDHLDEISIAADTQVAELNNGSVTEYTISPADFGVGGALDTLVVDSAEQSLAIVRDVLSGGSGPAADMVAINAGATIYAADVTNTLKDGVELAKKVIASGDGLARLEALATFSNQFDNS